MKPIRAGAGRTAAAVFVAAVIAFAAAGCDRLKHLDGDPAELAKRRVEFILATLKAEGGRNSGETQKAICRFDRDKVFLSDRDALEAAMDAFDLWRKDGGFYTGVQSYTVMPEARPAAAGDAPGTFYVDVKVNGATRHLRVPPEARISWAR